MRPLPVAAEGPPILVVITGSRDWTDADAIHADLSCIEQAGRLWGVVEGAARGADRIAGRWAEEAQRRGIYWMTMPADWQAHGRKAGPLRNRQMLAYAQSTAEAEGVLPVVLAYPLPGSIGTLDMMRVCAAAGLRVLDRSDHAPAIR